MTASSDLDLIVIYDFDAEHPNSDGKRPLYGAQYFARLTQRLISALTVQTNYGVLYEVDMRLRPSGRSGPLATHIDGFVGYQDREAWTWEHMALTRARVVSALAGIRRADRSRDPRRAVRRKRDAAAVAADVVEMRAAIAEEKGDADPWDLKYAAGGLVDIEFIAQYLQLVHAAARAGNPRHLDGPDAGEGGACRRARSRKTRPCCAPRCGCFTILRRFCGCACRALIRRVRSEIGECRRAGVTGARRRSAGFPRPAGACVETQRQVRECFVRILGKAP